MASKVMSFFGFNKNREDEEPQKTETKTDIQDDGYQYYVDKAPSETYEDAGDATAVDVMTATAENPVEGVKLTAVYPIKQEAMPQNEDAGGDTHQFTPVPVTKDFFATGKHNLFMPTKTQVSPTVEGKSMVEADVQAMQAEQDANLAELTQEISNKTQELRKSLQENENPVREADEYCNERFGTIEEMTFDVEEAPRDMPSPATAYVPPFEYEDSTVPVPLTDMSMRASEPLPARGDMKVEPLPFYPQNGYTTSVESFYQANQNALEDDDGIDSMQYADAVLEEDDAIPFFDAPEEPVDESVIQKTLEEMFAVEPPVVTPRGQYASVEEVYIPSQDASNVEQPSAQNTPDDVDEKEDAIAKLSEEFDSDIMKEFTSVAEDAFDNMDVEDLYEHGFDAEDESIAMSESSDSAMNEYAIVGGVHPMYDQDGVELCIGDEMCVNSRRDRIGTIVGLGDDVFFTESNTINPKTGYGDIERWDLNFKGNRYYHYKKDSLDDIIADITNDNVTLEDLIKRFRHIVTAIRERNNSNSVGDDDVIEE